MKLKASTTRALLLFSSFISSLILISTWVIASPPGGSPDEPTHLISSYCANEKYIKHCINPYLTNVTLGQINSVGSCYLFQRDRGAGCQESSLTAKIQLDNSSNFYKYPDKPVYFHLNNFYYETLSIFATDYFIFSLLNMRFINGSIFLFIFFLSIVILPKNYRNFFSISIYLVSVPLGLYLVTSINTSAWIVSGSIGLWTSTYTLLYSLSKRIFNLKTDLPRLFLFLISIFLMYSARFDGLYFILIITFAVAIVFLSSPLISILSKYVSKNKLLVIFPIFVLLITALIFYVFRSRAAIAFTEDIYDNYDRLFENFSKLPHLLLGPMGTWGLGWLDVWLIPITYLSMTIAVLGTLFVTMRKIDLSHALSIFFLSASVIALPLFIFMSSGYRVGEWVQPRYLLPLYFPLIGISLFSIVNKLVLSKLHIFFTIILVSVAHSAALFTNLERYIRGQNTYSYDLTVGLEWWWDQLPSPNLIWIFGSFSFIVMFISLGKLTKVENLNLK